jgi:uncharacterized membrane protein
MARAAVQLSEAELHHERWQPRVAKSLPNQRAFVRRDEQVRTSQSFLGVEMATRRFWNGFLAGTAAGAGAAAASILGWKLVGKARDGRVLRFERSLQIGRGVEEVFRAWSDLESLPQHVNFIDSVERHGDLSHWVANVGGRRVEWDAEITQYLPNEALGWKSVNGPKHTGRIDFSPIGGDTLVHVTMNYCPPGQLANMFAPIQRTVENYIEEAFRGFKFALEGKGREDGSPQNVNTSPTMQRSMSPTPSQMGSDVTGTPAMNQEQRATGTFGHASESDLNRHTQSSRFGGPETTVEYTRPPKAKS